MILPTKTPLYEFLYPEVKPRSLSIVPDDVFAAMTEASYVFLSPRFFLLEVFEMAWLVGSNFVELFCLRDLFTQGKPGDSTRIWHETLFFSGDARKTFFQYATRALRVFEESGKRYDFKTGYDANS